MQTSRAEVTNFVKSPLIEFREGFLKAKREFKAVLKNQENPFFHSTYASLGDYHAACDEALAKHGFTLHQLLDSDGVSNFLVTKLAHVDGHEEISRVLIRSKDDSDPQRLGSAITYLRRYALAAILGIASEDDDGNKGSDAGAGTKIEKSGKTNPAPAQKTTGSYDPNWLITFGKFAKSGPQKIGSVPLEDLQSYVSWLETDAATKGTPLKSNALTLKQMTESRAAAEQRKSEHKDYNEPPPMDDTDLSDIPF